MINKLLATTALITLISAGNARAASYTGDYTWETGPAINNTEDSTVTDALFAGNRSDNNGGAIVNNADASLTFNGKNSFEKNTAANGGAIFNRGKAKVTNSSFTKNEATTYYGGAIANLGELIINNSIFTENSSAYGGGAVYNQATGEISGSSFVKNYAKDSGGAIYNGNILTIDGVEFDGNYSDVDGGAVMANAINGIDKNETTILNSVFRNNHSAELGGAITVGKDAVMTVKNTLFENNYSDEGGAISTSTNTEKLTVTDSQFLKNHAQSIGAVGIFSEAELNNVIFEENESAVGAGGAVYLGAVSKTVMDKVSFIGNKAAAQGGAIAARLETTPGSVANNSAAKLDVVNSLFHGNQSGTIGGAIYNAFYHSENAEDSAYVANSTFTENEAADGGAVYNDGRKDAAGNHASLTLKDTTFTDNVAKTNGGAVYNDENATVNFAGTTVFSGNTAGGKANDIYNLGTINVSGDITLDGGILGNGSVIFDQDAKLTVTAGKTEIAGEVTTGGADLTILVKNGWKDGDVYKMVTGSVTDDDFTNFDNKNNLYDITGKANGTTGHYTIKRRDISEATGADANQAAAIAAIIAGEAENNDAFNQIADNIHNMLQRKETAKDGINAVKALSPAVAPLVQKTQTEHANQVFNAVSSRLTGGSVDNSAEGVSSGDSLFKRAAVWLTGIIGKSKLGTTAKADGFDADNYGVAFGIEKLFDNEGKIGVGYAYGTSDIDGFMRKADVDTHTAVVYGEYKPCQWFINGIASYSWSDYDERRNVTGFSVKSKYDVETLVLQSMTGYDFEYKGFGFTPELGMRYMHIDQEGYHDSIGLRYSKNYGDIVTGIIGAKFDRRMRAGKDTYIKPELRVAATYDFKNDRNSAVVVLPNSAVYQIHGDTLKRLGWEIGAGVTAEIRDNIDLTLGYEGRFRDHYQDHTGLVNAKYKF